MEHSDPVKNITPSVELAWYIPDLSERITPEVSNNTYDLRQTHFMYTNDLFQIRGLLENYADIPAADVVRHVHEVVS
jgi:hypothetical protein